MGGGGGSSAAVDLSAREPFGLWYPFIEDGLLTSPWSRGLMATCPVELALAARATLGSLALHLAVERGVGWGGGGQAADEHLAQNFALSDECERFPLDMC